MLESQPSRGLRNFDTFDTTSFHPVRPRPSKGGVPFKPPFKLGSSYGAVLAEFDSALKGDLDNGSWSLAWPGMVTAARLPPASAQAVPLIGCLSGLSHTLPTQ